MSLKSLTTGVAAAAVVAAFAVGATSVASAPEVTSTPVAPVVFGAPLPLDPATDVPTAPQLVTVLNTLADPGTSFRNKGYLVEGGLGFIESRTADRLLNDANAKGYLPLSFQVADIAPAGPGAVTSNVTASGPQLAPITQPVTFVNQNGIWKVSRQSATSLLQAALA